MTASGTTSPSRSTGERLVRPRWATAATFAVAGVITGSLASRIPALKTTLQLSDSVLGRTLFAIAVGALLSLQVAGRVVRRFGSRRAAWLGSMTAAGGVALTGATANLAVAVAGLFLYGAGNSLLDVAMNSQAVVVERSYRRPIMSSFHAMFSAGALVGAAGGALAAHAHLGQQAQYVLTAALGLGLLNGATWMMTPNDDPVDDSVAVDVAVVDVVAGTAVVAAVVDADPTAVAATDRPTGARAGHSVRMTILLFGLIAFAAMLSEGAAADWSGVHLRDSLHWTESAAARGFVVFQLFMTIGRMVGDRVIAAVGPRRTLIGASALATVGFAIGLASHDGWMFVAGLGALGLGLSVIVPIVFSAAATQPGSTGAAIARVSTIGYAGFLVGPPFIGQIAQWTSTGWALLLVPALCATGGLLTHLVLPRRTPRTSAHVSSASAPVG